MDFGYLLHITSKKGAIVVRTAVGTAPMASKSNSFIILILYCYV